MTAKDKPSGDAAVRPTHSVFVSHSSEDREAAYRLCELLEAQGIRCWIAPRDVIPGEPYGGQIIRALEDVDALVFLLSGHANASRHVESEVARAFERGMTIFPVRLEKILPSAELELFVTSAHWIEQWQAGPEKAAEELVHAVRTGKKAGQATPHDVSSRPGPAGVVAGLLWLLLLGALLCIALALFVPQARQRLPPRWRHVAERLSGGTPPPPERLVRTPPIEPPPPEPAVRPPLAEPDWPDASQKAAAGDCAEGAVVFESPAMEFLWIPTARVWMSKYEITNDQFRQFRKDHWSGRYKRENLDGDRQPVVRVSLEDARAFTVWMTQTQRTEGRLPQRWIFRLPRRGEWVAAAQCGDGRQYPWGDSLPPLYGNYADRAIGDMSWGWSYLDEYYDGHGVSCPVEDSGRNDWGLFGMGGNVWEWVEEPRHSQAMACGGGWDTYGEDAMPCVAHALHPPDFRTISVGFRLVLSRRPPRHPSVSQRASSDPLRHKSIQD